MKVLLHYNGAYNENAGVSSVALNLGKALGKERVNAEFLFGYGKGRGINSYLGALSGALHFLYHTPITALFFAAFMHGKEFDVVHCHTPEAGFDAVIARALLRKKYKVVVTLHGLDKAVRREWKKEVSLGKAEYRLSTDLYLAASAFKAWFSFKFADAFACVSGAVKRQAMELYGKNAEIIQNAVECPKGKPGRAAARKALGFSEKDFLVLFVGNAEWVKGLGYLAEAVEGISGAKLVVAGMGKEKGIKEKLGGRVLFTGYIPRSRLSKYYSAADVLCVPSLYEAFGLAYAEAMCFGLPCIASKGTGAGESIKDGFNGFLVKKRSVAEIREALKKARRKNINSKLGKNALKTAGAFPLKKAAEKYISVYKKCCR